MPEPVVEVAVPQPDPPTRYVVYEVVTGRILRIGGCPRSAVPLQALGPSSPEGVTEAVIEAEADDIRDYVSGLPATPTITPRPVMALDIDKTAIAADGLDAATITGIPVSATVTIGDTIVSVADGTLVFTTDTKGFHRLIIESFPYVPEEVFIDAT